MDLRGSEPHGRGVLHRLDHVGDEPPYLGGARIGDRLSPPQQNPMPHAGDLQNGHGPEDEAGEWLWRGLIPML